MTARVRSFAARPQSSYQAVLQGRQFVPHLQLLLDELEGVSERRFSLHVFLIAMSLCGVFEALT